MMKQKLSKAEKMLVKGLIELTRENNGYEANASNIENDLRAITGNNNMEHRQMVEDYAQELINKR